MATRPKSNTGLPVRAERQYGPSRGDGFTVTSDQEVAFSSKGDCRLPVRFRRLEVLCDDDKGKILVITDDMQRPSAHIVQAYTFR